MSQEKADIEQKVSRYESFLNETLRTDLKNTLLLRDKIYQEQAELLALRNSINAIKLAELVPGEPMKTKVDLGDGKHALFCWDNDGNQVDKPESWRNRLIRPRLRVSHMWFMGSTFGLVVRLTDALLRPDEDTAPVEHTSSS